MEQYMSIGNYLLFYYLILYTRFSLRIYVEKNAGCTHKFSSVISPISVYHSRCICGKYLITKLPTRLTIKRYIALRAWKYCRLYRYSWNFYSAKEMRS